MKKGETRTFWVGMIIAVFILLIVYFFLWGSGRDIIQKVLIGTPDFNTTSSEIDTPQILVFDITQNNVEYYDGINRIDFEKKGFIEFEDKKVEYQKVKDDFYNYYHGLYEYKNIREKNKRVSLPNSFLKEIYPENSQLYNQMPYSFDACIINIDRNNNIIMRLISPNAESCASRTYGEFLITPEKKVILKKVEKFENSIPVLESEYASPNANVKKTILEIATEWEDSILSTPMRIRFIDKNTNTEKTIKTCVEKVEKYLSADISKPSEKC